MILCRRAESVLLFLCFSFICRKAPAMRKYEVVFSPALFSDKGQFTEVTNINNPLRPKVLPSWLPMAHAVVLVADPEPFKQEEENWSSGSRVERNRIKKTMS